MRGFNPDALRQARLNAGYSQTEVARVAKVGTGTIRRWEQDDSSPQVDLLARVVEVLGVTIADVVQVPVDERYPGDWRVLLGLTQPQLGAKAGITTQIVSSVERGVISLSDNAAEKLSAALGIPESELRAAHERARNRPLGEPS
ncbi:helix-turn-helix transcriptional regulator [Rhodococcus artemisiae]|uniref:Helix-turn-helix transcriptional regulator n=1 Tax=Rhodococcus artemisiae TaxID=714159 RepID=A0ABU7LJ38_9NOCA|nr:helix-turn-helix transcriptional regulator [Rhodococcus artemisiae]MEE2061584.1 helix-turn-helix transcriptional regulator [Rhodococcus artemisiae]